MAQNYNIIKVEDTSFEPDAYGNKFYSVHFEGMHKSILWKTKSRPEAGSTVYGHTEPSKSGKSVIFKKDKLEDGEYPSNQSQASKPFTPQAGRKSDDERSQDIRWGLCIKEANGYVIANRKDLAADEWAVEVNEYANALYKLSKTPEKAPVDRVAELMGGDVLPTEEEVDNPIPLEDIPF